MQKLAAFFEKLKKAPAFVWVILVGAAYVFANYYPLHVSYNELLEGIRGGALIGGVDAEVFTQEMLDQLLALMTSPATVFVFLAMSGIIGIIIFEIIVYFVYRSLFVRRYATSDSKTFKTTARVVYAAANLFIGLYSLLFFLQPELYAFGLGFINFIVYTAAFTLGYMVLCESVIYPQYVADAFKRLHTLYFAISGVLAVWTLMTMIRLGDILPIISSAVNAGVVGAAGAILYSTLYKKLVERQKSYIVTPPPPPDNDEIYKGFGF